MVVVVRRHHHQVRLLVAPLSLETCMVFGNLHESSWYYEDAGLFDIGSGVVHTLLTEPISRPFEPW